MRAKNRLEKNESENEDGVVEHSKEQELESRKMSEILSLEGLEGSTLESDNCRGAGRTSWLYGEKIRNGGRFVVLK